MSILGGLALFGEAAKGAISIVPRPVWYGLAILASILLVRWQIESYGERKYDAGRADLIAEQAAAAVPIIAGQSKVTERVVTKYVEVEKKIYLAGKTIIKEVEIYVPRTDPDLPGGFRLFFDSSATGQVPDPAGIADAAPVAAQDVATTIAENHTACLVNAARLTSLQEWVREQERVSNGGVSLAPQPSVGGSLFSASGRYLYADAAPNGTWSPVPAD